MPRCGYCSLPFTGKAYIEEDGSDSDPQCYWLQHPDEAERTIVALRAQLQQAEAEWNRLFDDAWEVVASSLWNLEQCPTGSDHCNDVTRVHDRLEGFKERLVALGKPLEAK